MNRKIRVWDKQEKRMITDTQDFIPLIITNKGILRLNAEYKENLYTLIPFGDRFIPMEGVGLKDKLENEIYVGDIIEEVYPTGHINKGKIIYNKDAFEIEWISKNHFNNNVLNVRNKEIQVIGNIYED